MSAQGHQFQSSNLLWAALCFVVSISVDCGSDSTKAILLFPSVCEQCQRNQLEIWAVFKQSLCGVGGVKFQSPWHALPNTVFTLLRMEPVLSLSIWDDFTGLQKALACWRKMVCDCELCLYYFKYAFLGYHSLLTVVNKPFQNEIRAVSSY